MSDVLMSAPLTSDFIYDPHYRTQCVSLNAQAAAVPRGSIICVKGTLPVSATFTGTAATIAPTAAFVGTQAALSGDAENYTPAGTVNVTGASYTPAGSVSISEASGADGSFDVIGADDGAYGTPYGILLCDVAASESAQPADVIVLGECFRAYVDSVYAAANSGNHIPEPVVAALRNVGIILK